MLTIQECWTAKDQTGYYGTIFNGQEDALAVEQEDPNFRAIKGYRIIDDTGDLAQGTNEIYFDLDEVQTALASTQGMNTFH